MVKPSAPETSPPSNDELDADAQLVVPPAPTWRRPLLLTTGVLMLGLGVYTNADRLGVDLQLDERADVVRELSYLDNTEEEPPEEDEAGGPGAHLVFGVRHKGEEGKMGKPTSKAKSGLYAMKGSNNAIPQMARGFDPDATARQAGILGVMQQNQGQYLASPYGGAYAVGNDDADVWGGLSGSQVGQAFGVGGLGLVGTGRGGGGVGEGSVGNIGVHPGLIGGPGHLRASRGERYAPLKHSPFVSTKADAKSTFSIDVDTASYANVRRYLLEQGQLPPPEAVRSEELINYFEYDYALPGDHGAPFSVTTELGPCMWNSDNRLVHIGVQGRIPALEDTPARNLVFLIDVSGSMQSPDKLPLIKHGLTRLTSTLDGDDRVSIVVYAGASGAVLLPTRGSNRQAILGALSQLESGGGTNGAAGIEHAYALAEGAFIEGGINRVILASDGDFNVGISDHSALVELIEHKRESGVYLSVLGFGTGNYNDHTMEQLADKGNGNYAYIDGYDEAERVLGDQASAMLDAIAKDVKIQVEFDPEQVSEHRLVGYENRRLAHADFDDDRKDAGEIGAGHSVTAIYEIVPSEAALAAEREAGMSPMELSLRYKDPDAERSRKVSVPVRGNAKTLSESSTDYRFSAAVAAFAEALRGRETMSFTQIFTLAAGARGHDSDCYRHQFLELVHRAGTISGEDMAPFTSSCERDTSESRPARRVVEVDEQLLARESHDPVVHIHQASSARPAWMDFALEVLRLLPPLLALPLFFIAARSPRRRRRS